MPSGVTKEPLNGGISQIKHPIMLQPGELQRATNCILRPGDQALHKAPGRTAYGTVRSTSIACNTHSTTQLTSAALFGTDLATVTITKDSNVLTKAAGWGATAVGQSVWGAGIPVGSVVTRLSADYDTTHLQISQPATATSVGTVTIADLYVGTWIVGTGIPLYTTIVSLTNASTLTMSAAATNNDGSPVSRTFSENVVGVRALTFNHGYSDILIAKCQDKLYLSNLPTTPGVPTGTFSQLATGLSNDVGALLDTIHLPDDHYAILTGYDIPRILYYYDTGSAKSVTTRAMGMLPVTDQSFIGPVTITGSWSNLTDLGNGYYYFLVTEVAKFADGSEIEGTYAGDPKFAKITNYATDAIQVTYTSTADRPVNDGNYGRNRATHWRLYMAPKQLDELPVPDLAAFVKIGSDIVIGAADGSTTGVNQITLKDQNPFHSGYAASVAADGANLALFPSGTTNVVSQTAAQSVICTLSGKTLTATTGDFTTVTVGMFVQNANNYIPYGTYVKSKESITSLTLSDTTTVSAAGETVWFGNKPTFDNRYAICPVNSATTRRGGIFQNFGIQNIGAFSTATITGIEVIIRGAFNETAVDTGFVVEVSRDGTTFSNTNTICAFKKGSATRIQQYTIKLGGEFNLWGVSGWVPADFIDGGAKFSIRLRKIYGGDGEQWTHLIDGVRVIVHGGGHSINLEGDPFRTITIADQLGIAFATGANGPPPTANTGDIFEGMLILNDRTAETIICGSLPNEYEAFPDVYRIPIQSRDNDKVRLLRRLNNMLIIGCSTSMKRLNYFPRETDAEFSKGRCYEDLTLDHGIVGPRAAAIIDLPDRGCVLAYLAHNGLHFTDGTITHFLNDDINWATLIAPAYSDISVLTVYPRLNILALYYVPTGSTRKLSVLYFSYHPQHVKEGLKLPAVGPTSLEIGSATRLLLTGQTYLFTGHNIDGKVYVEDSGTTDASGYFTIEPNIRTRQFFLADLGRKARLKRLFMFVGAQGDATSGGFTATLYRQNTGEELSNIGSVVGLDTSISGLIQMFGDHEAETFALDINKSEADGQTSALDVHFLGWEVAGAHTQTQV